MQTAYEPVDECPRQQFDETLLHSIYVPDHDLVLPLELRSVISGVNTRLPTEAEIGRFGNARCSGF
jgi:hypothetical protein